MKKLPLERENWFLRENEGSVVDRKMGTTHEGGEAEKIDSNAVGKAVPSDTAAPAGPRLTDQADSSAVTRDRGGRTSDEDVTVTPIERSSFNVTISTDVARCTEDLQPEVRSGGGDLGTVKGGCETLGLRQTMGVEMRITCAMDKELRLRKSRVSGMVLNTAWR